MNYVLFGERKKSQGALFEVVNRSDKDDITGRVKSSVWTKPSRTSHFYMGSKLQLKGRDGKGTLGSPRNPGGML